MSRWRRWCTGGLLVGAALPLPAAVLALSVPAAERLAPLLVPGAVLLRPLSSAMAGWNGALNLLLLSGANGLLLAAAGAGLALVAGRRGRPRTGSGALGPGPARRVVAAVLAIVALLVVAVAVGVSALAGRYADRAARDLESVALDRGFDAATDTSVAYRFLVERLGLVSRNEEPFPYGYASLDLELDGCRLDDVLVSAVPDTRGWLPRRVPVEDVRFQLEYLEPGPGDDAGAYRRMEFRTAEQLLDQLAAAAPTGDVRDLLCRLRSSDGQAEADPAPAQSPAG